MYKRQNLNTVEIPFLVDSNTRIRFALKPDAAVLFARDGTYGPWQRIVFVDAAMATILNTVMTRLADWQRGEDFERFSYFATLLGHPDDRIHKMVLRELDQADYSILRRLDLKVDADRLLARLNDPFEANYKAIRILLLGLSGDALQQDILKKGIEQSVSSEGRHLGAFATASIELGGAQEVESITSTYLTDRDLSIFARELLIEAMSLHVHSAEQTVQTAVSDAIESALWFDASLGGPVARQFGARGNWSFAPALQALLEEGKLYSVSERQDVVQYLAIAENRGAKP